MTEFFKPWRRRIGVVTLITACVLMSGWMRSYRNVDEFRLGDGDEKAVIVFRAADNGLTCERHVAVRGVAFHYEPGWCHYTILHLVNHDRIQIGGDWGIAPEGVIPSLGGMYAERDIYKSECCGFQMREREFEFGDSSEKNKYRKSQWTLPWWSLVLLPTLLSAYLLLTNPSKLNQMKAAEPTAIESE